VKIACLKFAGLGSGGTEKYLQTMACVLKKKHDVDYFYTNNAPMIGTSWRHPENCEKRKQYVESHGIKTVPIHLDAYDNNSKTWIGSNIWDVFDPTQYDVVQTARYGFPEFPFTHIKGTKIVDSIHGDASDRVSRVERSILLCRWQADKWVRSGGDASKISIIPGLVYVPDVFPVTTRAKYGIPEDAFVYGIHQRNDDGIFSPVALMAYSQIQNNNTYFLVLGGSSLYRKAAEQLNLKNVIFVDFSPDPKDIHDFLNALDVYAHARSDGEVCSASITEALYHGLPVITHPGQNMGHEEQIEGCGKMAYSVEEYAREMLALQENESYRQEKSHLALQRYTDKYCYKTVEQNILDLYESLA
jgi:glycosyltransferase involved in cell wall biosynthesis